MSSTDFRFVIDPELEVNSSEFAEVWNEIAECRESGELVPSSTSNSSDDFEFDPMAIFIGSLIGAGVVMTKDMMQALAKLAWKSIREKTDKKDEIEIVWVNDPDEGVPVIQIKKKS